MDFLKECILTAEVHGIGDEEKKKQRRRVYNFMAKKVNANVLDVLSTVQCKKNAMVFKVRYMGSKAFLKIMSERAFQSWKKSYGSLTDAQLGHFHPQVFDSGLIDDAPYGYTFVEAFGESIEEYEQRQGRSIDHEFYEDAKEWTEHALKQMHRQNVFHGDLVFNERLHKGNIVFVTDDEGRRKFKFIDIGAVSDDDDSEVLRKEKYSLSLMKGSVTRAPRKKRRVNRARPRSFGRELFVGNTMSDEAPAHEARASIGRKLF